MLPKRPAYLLCHGSRFDQRTPSLGFQVDAFCKLAPTRSPRYLIVRSPILQLGKIDVIARNESSKLILTLSPYTNLKPSQNSLHRQPDISFWNDKIAFIILVFQIVYYFNFRSLFHIGENNGVDLFLQTIAFCSLRLKLLKQNLSRKFSNTFVKLFWFQCESAQIQISPLLKFN
jgi:hypothetical protein